jgi:PAT family beta-lactamase induction signal transducer AmpG
MERRAPAWLVGITYIPFGLYNGFVAIAMPFLLTARGVPLDHVLALQFFILLPSFLSFLVTPLVDCGISRRAWAMLCSGLAGAALLSGVLMLDTVARGTTALFVSVMLLGYLAAQMFSSAMGGMIPNLVAEEHTGTVSAWLNTAYLGGSGIGGWLGSVLVPKLGLSPAAIVLGLVVFAPCLLLLIIGAEHRTPRGASETMRRLMPDILAVSRTRSAIVGLLIFVTPSATFAAQNSFSGLGRDFHAGDAAVTWITGWGSAILCSVGAMLGGWLVQRKGWTIDRRMVFVATGVVAAVASLGMAFGSHTAAVFFAGTAVYYILAGINDSAACAVAFDIMGVNNPLSATQYAMLMAACNLAIETVLKGDQWGYKHGSAKGLLLTDAAFSLVIGSIMLTVIHLWGGTGREQVVSIRAAPEMI